MPGAEILAMHSLEVIAYRNLKQVAKENAHEWLTMKPGSRSKIFATFCKDEDWAALSALYHEEFSAALSGDPDYQAWLAKQEWEIR